MVVIVVIAIAVVVVIVVVIVVVVVIAGRVKGESGNQNGWQRAPGCRAERVLSGNQARLKPVKAPSFCDPSWKA